MPSSNFFGAISEGLAFKEQRERLARQQEGRDLSQAAAQGGIGSQAFKSLAAFDPDQAAKLKGLLKTDEQGLDAAFNDVAVYKSLLTSSGAQRAAEFLQNRVNLGEQQGRDMFLTKGLLETTLADPEAGLREAESFLSIPQELSKKRTQTAGEREFETLTSDLSDEEKKQAKLIKLGLSPRAVGSAIQTISDKGIEELIGKSKATIRQREKFGELTASRRSKAIDNGFGKIEKITAAVDNIDRAIGVLNSGAGVGALQKFLPSFKAASVELDNIQKSMALDVIGATTFGALSEGELNLAKEVALPTGLDTQQLIQHLENRKAAQEKLRNYYNEQIDFLDQGGTVAGFLRSKEREAAQAAPKEQQTAPVQTFNFDAQGNLIQ